MSGAFGDMGNLLRQAQKMQRELQRLRQGLKEKVVEGTAGGGAVRANCNAAGEVLAVKIDPEVVAREEVGLLEDLVVAAVSSALKKAEALREEELGRITGGMNLPGLL